LQDWERRKNSFNKCVYFHHMEQGDTRTLLKNAGFRARRGEAKKRSIHLVCEHFETTRNTAMRA
jgi:hypothetical protein